MSISLARSAGSPGDSMRSTYESRAKRRFDLLLIAMCVALVLPVPCQWIVEWCCRAPAPANKKMEARPMSREEVRQLEKEINTWKFSKEAIRRLEEKRNVV